MAQGNYRCGHKTPRRWTEGSKTEKAVTGKDDGERSKGNGVRLGIRKA